MPAPGAQRLQDWTGHRLGGKIPGVLFTPARSVRQPLPMCNVVGHRVFRGASRRRQLLCSYARISRRLLHVHRSVADDRSAMRIVAAFVAALSAGMLFAKLPPPSDEARAKAAEASAKSAWTDKVGAYKTCVAADRVVENYRKARAAQGKEVRPAIATPPCADPGPYVARPLEAAGAHSPPETNSGPPGGPKPQAAGPQPATVQSASSPPPKQ